MIVLTSEKMFSWNPAAGRGTGLVVLLVFSSLLGNATSPQTKSPTTTAQQREAYAQKFVAQRLQVWQDRLDLRDWKIQIRLVRPSELEPQTLGNIHWDTDSKEASIGVLSTYDYKLPWQAMLDDMEFTVVHELVHLHLASLPRSEASRRVEEHAVNELADALLKLAKH